MKLDDFDFDLPERLIATRPVSPRSSARLLVADGDQITDARVFDLPEIFRPGDLLVLNDTKVLPARLTGLRRRGGAEARIELTLLSADANGCWRALVKPLRKLKEGERVEIGPGFAAVLEEKSDGLGLFSFELEGMELGAALEKYGIMPLPPYIAARRPADAHDRADYQTVFAKRDGAVAAPTASLHFDAELLEKLKETGVEFAHVTLHVGAGTFLPVKVEDISRHRMHAEWGEVSHQAARAIAKAKVKGRRVIPVGTTALRLIETAAQSGKIEPWIGETDIFIYPGFRFRVTDALMTNFHLPKSTLMMLVAALMGKERIDAIYAHAIAQEYRFFSYGDSSLLIPPSTD